MNGVVADYAVGGAMALVFWSEPVPTFDLGVFVLLAFDWALRTGYREQAEHIIIAVHNKLVEEAVASAAELDFEGQPVRVIRPEYLIAL